MLDPNYTQQFAEYEAPVYVTFNHKNNITTLGPASGHPSTVLYFRQEIRNYLASALPAEYKTNETYPHELLARLTHSIVKMVADLQLAYYFYLNSTTTLPLTEEQLRGLKVSASSMRVEAELKEVIRHHHPLTEEIILPYLTQNETEPIQKWLHNIRTTTNQGLIDVAGIVKDTLTYLPKPPANTHVGADAAMYHQINTTPNSNEYTPTPGINPNLI